MFTGIITDNGIITGKSEAAEGDIRFTVRAAGFDMGNVAIGASIACDGCCLTVVEKGADWFAVDVSRESIAKTTLKSWGEGYQVNLERSLCVGDELGGHIVSGHVDGPAVLESVTPDGGSYRLKIRAPHDLARYVATKGSVALNGISLTVNEVDGDIFGINIIPHTWEHTNLKNVPVGGTLNMEVDMLARYVARMTDFDKQEQKKAA